MLKNVHLKNLALIKEAEIDFTDGLNIMTGETGSGKSIIIGGINIALGDKANKAMIRTGSSFGLVELLFVHCSEKALSVLDDLGIERDGRNILITRKITQDSSISKINGENVTLNNLKKVTSLLVDVHGQHDHQSLLNPAMHSEILDSFGGAKILDSKTALQKELSVYKSLKEEFKEFDKDEAALEREISLLEYEVSEIEEAGLLPGEDITLEESFRAMKRSLEIYENLSKISYLFADESKGILSDSSAALKEMNEALRSEPSLLSLKNQLADIDSLSKDFFHELSKYIDENSFSREKFDEISERLNLINRLKSKYGETIEDILNYQTKGQSRLDFFKDFEENKKALNEKLLSSRAKINNLAKELSKARKETARILEPLICENLKDLNFLNCEFKIDFQKASKISKDGFDKIQFMISLNPGEPLKPLSGVASGGELSRIMLALKSALAGHDKIETLIFDEIDTGISGQAAAKVSEKLKSLSRTHQVICITHLPQIAARADSHFLIEKEVEGQNTISGIKLLSDELSIKELAKMISGSEITPAALEHARELKK